MKLQWIKTLQSTKVVYQRNKSLFSYSIFYSFKNHSKNDSNRFSYLHRYKLYVLSNIIFLFLKLYFCTNQISSVRSKLKIKCQSHLSMKRWCTSCITVRINMQCSFEKNEWVSWTKIHPGTPLRFLTYNYIKLKVYILSCSLVT